MTALQLENLVENFISDIENLDLKGIQYQITVLTSENVIKAGYVYAPFTPFFAAIQAQDKNCSILSDKFLDVTKELTERILDDPSKENISLIIKEVVQTIDKVNQVWEEIKKQKGKVSQVWEEIKKQKGMADVD